jgi:hypothetical protein
MAVRHGSRVRAWKARIVLLSDCSPMAVKSGEQAVILNLLFLLWLLVKAFAVLLCVCCCLFLLFILVVDAVQSYCLLRMNSSAA